ncbi:unnamed protein product [Paramecium sonneborni]|uniref:Transmembrane protein n=1 Tax=Paramecium sonneborni TaxID=65129 RepID=A0A8S1RPA0_9CILI|nr:unnamed protein product [Paramecium sonneborni]
MCILNSLKKYKKQIQILQFEGGLKLGIMKNYTATNKILLQFFFKCLQQWNFSFVALIIFLMEQFKSTKE